MTTTQSANHVFEIDGCYWYSAETEEEAVRLFSLDGGNGFDEDFAVEQLPDDKPLTVCHVDEAGQPKVTRPAGEWAKDGKGCVASTEY